MTDHRALQSIKAAKAIIIAAGTSAGADVEIGRTSDVTEDACVDLNIGTDSPVNEFGTDNTNTIDSVQRLFVDLHVRSIGHEEEVIERLYQLRSETHAALLADWTLGLAFVISIRYLGTDEFTPDMGGERLGSMRTVWDIAYRMGYSNPAT